MDNSEIKRRIKQNRFATNNGMVLRTVHMLGEKYTDLEDLRYGLEPSMLESELTDCLLVQFAGNRTRGTTTMEREVAHWDLRDARTPPPSPLWFSPSLLPLSLTLSHPCYAIRQKSKLLYLPRIA